MEEAIILVRVSTLIQDTKPQIDDLTNYAKSKGYKVVKIIETKESGFTNFEVKQGTNEMFSYLNDNPTCKTVIATEISRLARRQSVLHTIKEYFVKNKIQFICKDTNYSLFDDAGKETIGGNMMFTLYGMFAENEMREKKDRFIRSKQSLMRNGFSISGKTLFGYKRKTLENKRTTLIKDDNDSKIVTIIYDWYLNGIDKSRKNPSIKTITLECIIRGFPKYTHIKRNVNKLLKEQGYTGYKVTNNKRKNPEYNNENSVEKYIITNNEIKYPQIIDNETFEKVQTKLLSNNTNVEKSSKHTTILSKLILCKCGARYNANYRVVKGLDKSSYRCSSRSSAKPCNNKNALSLNLFDSAIWNIIKSDLEVLTEQIKIKNPDSVKWDYKQRIENLQASKDALISKFETTISMYLMLINNKNTSKNHLKDFEIKSKEHDKHIKQIDNEIAKLQSKSSINKDLNINILQKINDNILEIEKSKELLKEYVNTFVEHIEILNQSVKHSVIKVRFYDNSINNRDERGISEPIEQYTKRLFKLSTIQMANENIFVIDKTITRNIKLYKVIDNEDNVKLITGTLKNPIITNLAIDEQKEFNEIGINENLIHEIGLNTFDYCLKPIDFNRLKY